jgi:DNA-binding response OmpR family regulator
MTGDPVLTLLIVDDEPSIATGLARLLARRGFSVANATNRLAAIEILTTRHIDILLIDYRMPDIRGDVLYASALALQPHLRARTIFLTGDPSDEAQQVIAETGCRWLMKPFDLPELEEALRGIARAIRGDTNQSSGAA